MLTIGASMHTCIMCPHAEQLKIAYDSQKRQVKFFGSSALNLDWSDMEIFK